MAVSKLDIYWSNVIEGGADPQSLFYHTRHKFTIEHKVVASAGTIISPTDGQEYHLFLVYTLTVNKYAGANITSSTPSTQYIALRFNNQGVPIASFFPTYVDIEGRSYIACSTKLTTLATGTYGVDRTFDSVQYQMNQDIEYRLKTLSFSFRIIPQREVTFDNTAGKAPATLTIGSTTLTAPGGQKVSTSCDNNAAARFAVDATVTYSHHFTGWKQGPSIISTAQSTTRTITADTTLAPQWDENPTFTVEAPPTATIRVTMAWTIDGKTTTEPTVSIAPGSSQPFPRPPSPASVAMTIAAQMVYPSTFVAWTRDGNRLGSPSSSSGTITSPVAGSTYSLIARTPYTVTIKAPAGIAIDYTFGIDGEEVASGTVASGSSRPVSLYRETDGNMTLVLEASPFDYRTFGGWTKDGAVIDRWSNPATLVANEAATYSCLISPGGDTPSSGELLCGRYGELLFADPTKPSTSHTVRLSADFKVSGHTLTSMITRVGEAEYETTQSIDSDFTRTRILSFPAIGGTPAGALLYADKVIAGTLPRLIKVMLHCQVPEHEYSVSVTIDGEEVYAEQNLSGTFSKTLEVD